MNFMVIVYLLTSIFYILIGTFSLMYDIKNKLNRIFFVFCLDLSLWSTALMLMNAASDAATATVFRQTATIFWSFVYCLMLHFLLVLVEKDRLLSNPLYLGLFYLPAMISIYIYYIYNPVTEDLIVRSKYGWSYWNSGGNGLLIDFYLPLYYCTYVLASIFIILFWGKQSPLKREKKQAKIIVVTIIAVFVLGSLTDIILPVLGKPIVPALTVCFIVIPVYGIWYSIKRYRLMNLNPQNIVAEVLRTMNEGMLITDRSHCIRDINEGARMMLGYSKEELLGKPLEFVVKNMHDNTIKPANELMLLRKDNQMLWVSFSSSMLLDEWNELYGTVLLFQDLSENKRIQKELQASHDELEQKVLDRTRELNAANRELQIEIDSRIGMEKEIRKLAFYDHLTGLPNNKS